MRIAIFPVGSRGDVQPYVALAVALQRAGHDVVIPVSRVFRTLVTEAGLDFCENTGYSPQDVTGDAQVQAELRKGGQLRALMAVLRRAGPMLESIFDNAWTHSEGADGIIASFLPWGALDSAEKRGLPAIWAPLHPMYPTRAFPSPFLSPGRIRFNHPLNPLTFQVLRVIGWQFGRVTVNRWRRERLNLPPLPFSSGFAHMDARRLPVLYAFSTHVLPAPADWPDWHQTSGYWFLDEPSDWQPPADLARFLAAGPPPVFIGFGSMDDRQSERVTEIVLKALQISGQRGIIQSGWMGLGSMQLPENVLRVDSLLHSWLFPRMAAVVHHGGAGTTAAGLRAGVPSIIAPVMGDQLFWAQRIEQLGVGFSPSTFYGLTPDALAGAITRAVGDPGVRERAAQLGVKIRDENGVGRAVQLIQQVLS